MGAACLCWLKFWGNFWANQLKVITTSAAVLLLVQMSHPKLNQGEQHWKKKKPTRVRLCLSNRDFQVQWQTACSHSRPKNTCLAGHMVENKPSIVSRCSFVCLTTLYSLTWCHTKAHNGQDMEGGEIPHYIRSDSVPYHCLDWVCWGIT